MPSRERMRKLSFSLLFTDRRNSCLPAHFGGQGLKGEESFKSPLLPTFFLFFPRKNGLCPKETVSGLCPAEKSTRAIPVLRWRAGVRGKKGKVIAVEFCLRGGGGGGGGGGGRALFYTVGPGDRGSIVSLSSICCPNLISPILNENIRLGF